MSTQEQEKTNSEKRKVTDEEKSKVKPISKLFVERSLMSTPFYPPAFAYDNVQKFVSKILEVRSSKLLEGNKEDFKKVEQHSVALLTLRTVESFEIDLGDMIVRFSLIESSDKSAEDMDLPILLPALEPLICERPTLTIHFKPTVSASIISLAEELVRLDTKVLRLKVAEISHDEAGEEGE